VCSAHQVLMIYRRSGFTPTFPLKFSPAVYGRVMAESFLSVL
jgi:hypothetical protein